MATLRTQKHNHAGDAQDVGPRQRMRTPAAAAYLRISSSLLEKLRGRGTGPRYAKLGKIVVYERSDLDLWADSAKRHSTSAPAPEGA
jgi:hypothetical protein